MAEIEFTGGPDELTAAERADFERIDATIVRIRDMQGLPFGQRLREMRDRRLFRAWRPPTWRAYVEDRACITRRRANQLIAYADLWDEWEVEPGFPFPPTERHGRPLAGLTAEQRRRVLDDLGGTFEYDPTTGKPVTAKGVADAAAVASGRRLPDRPPGATVATPGRGPVPLSHILHDLAEVHRRLVRVVSLGPNVISDAVEAVPPGGRDEVSQQVEESARVILLFVRAVERHYPADDGPAQERMTLAA
jgi:hypothetical protein